MKKLKNEKEIKKEKEEIEVKSSDQEPKKIRALVTSRILFISVLDKIYLIALIIMFISLTWSNFQGEISSMSYGFWSRVGRELLILLIMAIVYFFLNWFYKCAVKTMLCVTKNEVYKESYIPFKRSELSIPLNKITRVTAINVFWIFRSIIIHQYNKFPLIFFTWNNQEFKDKVSELIIDNKTKIENEFEDKNIISKKLYKYIKYFALAFAAFILLLGIIRFIAYLSNDERKIPGTYVNENIEIVLEKDGECNIDKIIDNKILDCSWSNNENQISIHYEYEYTYSFSSSTYTGYDTVYLDYNSSDKTLKLDEVTFTKK